MNTKLNKVIKKVKNTEYKVIRVDNTEFELDNGDIYPHNFELDSDITVDEFQKLLDDSKDLVLNLIKNIEDTNE